MTSKFPDVSKSISFTKNALKKSLEAFRESVGLPMPLTLHFALSHIDQMEFDNSAQIINPFSHKFNTTKTLWIIARGKLKLILGE